MLQLHVYSLGLKVEAEALENFPTSWALNCFVLATTIVDAVARANRALLTEGFRVEDMYQCMRLRLAEYEQAEPTHPAIGELRMLVNQGDYVLAGATFEKYLRLTDRPPNADSGVGTARHGSGA